MSEMQNLELGAHEINRIDYRAPKTIKQWCKLYHELAGRDVYYNMSWGDGTESKKQLTHNRFQTEAKKCLINLEDAKLIAETADKIEE